MKIASPQYMRDSFFSSCTAAPPALWHLRSRRWYAAVWVLLYGPWENLFDQPRWPWKSGVLRSYVYSDNCTRSVFLIWKKFWFFLGHTIQICDNISIGRRSPKLQLSFECLPFCEWPLSHFQLFGSKNFCFATFTLIFWSVLLNPLGGVGRQGRSPSLGRSSILARGAKATSLAMSNSLMLAPLLSWIDIQKTP